MSETNIAAEITAEKAAEVLNADAKKRALEASEKINEICKQYRVTFATNPVVHVSGKPVQVIITPIK